jgi:hypothetical protein
LHLPTISLIGLVVSARTRGTNRNAPSRRESPGRRLLSLEAREHLRSALATLPERQRVVVALRDVEGASAAEVRDLLALSPENQRVLLHRGRSRLRATLEDYVRPAGVPETNADEVTCREFVELVTAYLDGALDSSALELVEEHLVMCDWCVDYLGQMQTTLDCLRALRHVEESGPPRARLLAAVRARAQAGP